MAEFMFIPNADSTTGEPLLLGLSNIRMIRVNNSNQVDLYFTSSMNIPGDDMGFVSFALPDPTYTTHIWFMNQIAIARATTNVVAYNLPTFPGFPGATGPQYIVMFQYP